MGTQDPLVHIEAATLAGGANNQDRYAYGDGWAFVLDGATSFAETPPVHDGGWYAELLQRYLADELSNHPNDPSVNLVARSIRRTAEHHNTTLHGPIPAATIAMARWANFEVELYVLGDSCAAIANSSHKVVHCLTDERIDRVGSQQRAEYRKRLAQGYGFDAQHRRRLADLQSAQLSARNRQDGYWIAGNVPEAASHALIRKYSIPKSATVLLFTDGVCSIFDLAAAAQKLAMATNPAAFLNSVQATELSDPLGRAYPRSKKHDDKSAVTVRIG